MSPKSTKRIMGTDEPKAGAEQHEAPTPTTQLGSVLTDPASEKPKVKSPKGKKAPGEEKKETAKKPEKAPKEPKPKKERAVDQWGFGVETKRHKFVELLREKGPLSPAEFKKELGGFSHTKTWRILVKKLGKRAVHKDGKFAIVG
jgi:hypothetical protein